MVATTLLDFSSFSFSYIRTKQSLPTLCHVRNRPFCGHAHTKKLADKNHSCDMKYLPRKVGQRAGRGISTGHPSVHRKGQTPELPNFSVPFYLCIHCTLCCRTTKFDVVTRGEGGLFLGDSHAPTLMAAGPSAPQFRSSLLIMRTPHSLSQNYQI